jgi:hypothetical protein
MAASLLENGEDPNASTTKTRTSAKNQAESELFKSALFQQARWFVGTFHERRLFGTSDAYSRRMRSDRAGIQNPYHILWVFVGTFAETQLGFKALVLHLTRV